MRRLLSISTALFVVAALGTTVIAQKVTTVEQLDATMKRVGENQQATGKALKSGAYADARKSMGAVKQALMEAENFWVMNKKDDAVKMSKEVIANLTKIEEALGAAAPDQQALFAMMKGAGCGNCHKAYRQENPDKTYSLRPGSI
jgi:cytochrome c556